MYKLLLYAAVGRRHSVGLAPDRPGSRHPVHLRARTRRWGLAEVLAFVELPVFLASLVCWC